MTVKPMTGKGISTYEDVKVLEALPLQDRHLPNSILAAIMNGDELGEGRDALIFLPDATRTSHVFRWTYGELITAIRQTGAGLKGLSTKDSPVISLLLPNLPETHFSLWGGQCVGQVNPINPLLEPEQIADIMGAAGSDILVTLAAVPGTDLFDKAVAACRLVPAVQTLITVNPAHYMGGIKGQIGSLAAKIKTRAQGLKIVPFSRLAGIGKEVELPIRGWNDVGALFHTGGTTGSPKIAQLTHGNQIFSSWAAATNRFMEKNPSIFCGLPLFHINGALVTGLVPWMKGATVFLGPPQGFRAKGLMENFWSIIETHKIGAMSAVPTIYQMLLDQTTEGHDISSMEFAICGAAPMPKALLDKFHTKTGVPLLEGYGFTEGACISTINPGYGPQRLGSVGFRLPYQNINIFQETPDGKGFIPVSPNQPGVIGIRGPNIFKGYLSPVDDAKAWISWQGEAWYNTGDLGRIDEEGYLWLTGRQKELIIRGGHNIDPALIEAALNSHPAIDQAAAIGAPDPKVGEVPVAYVTLVKGVDIQEQALIRHVKNQISERAAIPKHIRIIDQMPLTALGKIYKPALKRRETTRVITQVIEDILGPNLVIVALGKQGDQDHMMDIYPKKGSFSDTEVAALKTALDCFALNIRINRCSKPTISPVN